MVERPLAPLPASVMIVTRNRPMFLEWCLNHLMQQQDIDLEIVVVDDASEVDLEPIVDRFRDRARIVLVRMPQYSGAAAGRNVGFRSCTHEVIIQLDDDSRMVEPDAAWRIARYMQDHRDVGALALRIFYPWSGSPDGVGEPYSRWNEPHLTEEYSFQACGVAFRRPVVLATGYADEFVYGAPEDFLGARIIAAGSRIHLFGECRVVHGDDTLTPLERSEIQAGTKRIYHISHLAVTHYLLFPFPLNLLSAAASFASLVVREPRSAIASIPRILELIRKKPRQPMRWIRALHWYRLRWQTHAVRKAMARSNQ